MRLDHIAYRVADRKKTAQFLIDAFGYRVQTEFDLKFDDDSTTKCIALEPAESVVKVMLSADDGQPYVDYAMLGHGTTAENVYHMAPEIFVSDGSSDSIVGRWVEARAGVGGIHHLAYEVSDVEFTMDTWTKKGWATFASKKPLRCPGLVQVFTEPHPLTGVIYEFIERRGAFGFCTQNVKDLMLSTGDFK